MSIFSIAHMAVNTTVKKTNLVGWRLHDLYVCIIRRGSMKKISNYRMERGVKGAWVNCHNHLRSKLSLLYAIKIPTSDAQIQCDIKPQALIHTTSLSGALWSSWLQMTSPWTAVELASNTEPSGSLTYESNMSSLQVFNSPFLLMQKLENPTVFTSSFNIKRTIHSFLLFYVIVCNGFSFGKGGLISVVFSW